MMSHLSLSLSSLTSPRHRRHLDREEFNVRELVRSASARSSTWIAPRPRTVDTATSSRVMGLRACTAYFFLAASGERAPARGVSLLRQTRLPRSIFRDMPIYKPRHLDEISRRRRLENASERVDRLVRER